MANLDDAINTLRLIARHAELLVSSHLNNSGEIPITQENENLIRTLKSSRLVWQLDDVDSVQVSGVLTRLIDHSLVNYRRHIAHEYIADIWTHITQLINNQYYPAKSRCATMDLERITTEIQELCIELIEMIHTSTIRFSEYISSKFAFISDLDLRIKKNEIVIAQAQRLNDLLNTFTVDELSVACGSDSDLRKIFLKTLSKEIEKSRRNLLNSLHQLTELLHSLRESAAINKLLESFERKYNNDRGFTPSIASLSRYPVFLRFADNCISENHADIRNILHEDIFEKLCRNIVDIEPTVQHQRIIISVDDKMNQADAIIDQDSAFIMAEALILAAQQSEHFISALDIFDKIDNHPYDIWLYTIINSIESLPTDMRNSIVVDIIEKPDAIYPHNYEVLDIRVKSNATKDF